MLTRPKTATALLVALVALLLGLFVVHAAAYEFLCDDAFISFRYVRNWLDGKGLVFNAGERVEGYTNFLWVIELAAIWEFLGVRPEVASIALSSSYTVGTVVLLGALALSRRPAPARWWGLVIALALWVTNRTAAVWTTSGLETRQFTFFVLLGVYAFSRYRRSARWLLAGSFALAAAEYTRPEALMLGPLCVAWYGLDSRSRGRFRWQDALRAAAPFAVLVLGHFAFRYAYYGELLPNTYYAKQTGPWPRLGFAYLGLAALEYGLYLVVPLAVAGTVSRVRQAGDTTHLLMWTLIAPHMAYLVYLGGDHFEFRPTDFYWPLLYLATADGVLAAGAWARRRLAARGQERAARAAAPAVAAALTALVLVYGATVGLAYHRANEHRTTRAQTFRLRAPLTEDNAGWLFAIPGMGWITAGFNRLLDECVSVMSGVRQTEHEVFWQHRSEQWRAYERFAGTGFLPEDAVTTYGTAGIMPFYLPDLTVIDTWGLTDAVIARNPDLREQRQIAHARQPPPGYLASRGLNIDVRPAATSIPEALKRAPYAVRLDDEVWMPVRSSKRRWLEQSFADATLIERPRPLTADPGAEVILAREHVLRVRRWLGRFDDDLDGWRARGDDAARLSLDAARPGQARVKGRVGRGMLNTFAPDTGDQAEVRYASPEFRPRPDERLVFFVGGGEGPDVAVELHGPDGLVRRWHGRNRDRLRRVTYELAAHVGEALWIEVVDRAGGAWGHILADHFLLGAPMTEDEAIRALAVR